MRHESRRHLKGAVRTPVQRGGNTEQSDQGQRPKSYAFHAYRSIDVSAAALSQPVN
jgi:hypothetical protein